LTSLAARRRGAFIIDDLAMEGVLACDSQGFSTNGLSTKEIEGSHFNENQPDSYLININLLKKTAVKMGSA
jgi:hypothetical protein